jgi:hypothetical protein
MKWKWIDVPIDDPDEQQWRLDRTSIIIGRRYTGVYYVAELGRLVEINGKIAWDIPSLEDAKTIATAVAKKRYGIDWTAVALLLFLPLWVITVIALLMLGQMVSALFLAAMGYLVGVRATGKWW